MSRPELPWWASDFLRAARRGAGLSARGSVSVAPGVATALVEGRGFRPSEVRLRAPVLEERRWESFYRVFTEQALYPAALFAGYLAKPVKADLARRGVRLVPSANRISFEPGDAAPETLAGACRLVAESFAADPFRLLRFRGADRETVLGEITRRWRAGTAGGSRRFARRTRGVPRTAGWRAGFAPPGGPAGRGLPGRPGVARGALPPLHEGLRARRRGGAPPSRPGRGRGPLTAAAPRSPVGSPGVPDARPAGSCPGGRGSTRARGRFRGRTRSRGQVGRIASSIRPTVLRGEGEPSPAALRAASARGTFSTAR